MNLYHKAGQTSVADAFAVCHCDIEALLAPVAGESGVGVWLRYEPLYQQIRDAQREDDPTLPMGEWDRPLVKADWKAVAGLCADALSTRSKDFQLAAWLCDAWTRLFRLDGFVAGLQCLSALIERYWETGWPRFDGDDTDARVAPFVWLVDGLSRTLTLHLALVEIEGREPSQVSLDDWLRMAIGNGEDAEAGGLTLDSLARYAAQPGNSARLAELHRRLDLADDGLRCLARQLDERLGNHAPGFAPLTKALGQLRQAAVGLLGERARLADEADVTANSGGDAVLSDAAAVRHEGRSSSGAALDRNDLSADALVPAYGIANRAQAYRLLEAVSDYLALNEPHSPTPYLLRRAIAWEHMPLPELLLDVMGEGEGLARYLAWLNPG
ncbi:type VI secretion system protein TssA [Burkholderia sp. WAC0059]|uniref:type VI secretion system protein TssA n=1 Tax=Burkholderia sp. WAC0059 TaxID=2066022 RepID=UPI000C7F5248|nr:type VI secretion system protein TssA [Burkholderia sp. WAC0059]PLZ00084.1 type VI secretion system protein TssA [Burkholderia sp. WAC0059]